MLFSALSGHPCPYAFDAVSQSGSSLLLGRVLAKTTPPGIQAKVTYVLVLSDEEKKQLPAGVDAERTAVGTAYEEDEICKFHFSCIFHSVDFRCCYDI